MANLPPFLDKQNPKKIGLISLLILAFAVGLGFYGAPKLIDSNIQKLNLKPGTENRFLWEKTPFPLTFKIYLFNLTNPLDVVDGKKPKLQQIGPYVFEEWKRKDSIVDHEEEDAVSFDMVNTYHFKPELSSGNGEEIVTVPHALLMGGLIGTKRDREALLSIVVKAFQQIFQPQGTPFLTAKVMDILFNGVGIDCNREEFEAMIVCPNLSKEKAITVINETYFSFSLFGQNNGTSLGRYKVLRGTKDISQVGKVLLFNDNEESTVYKGQCNVIKGTDGTIFAPYQKKSNVIYSYSPTFCRSLGVTYLKEGSYNGVPTSIFTVKFEDLKANSDHHCFCRQQKVENCPPKGTFDLYPCMGAPLLTSKPHFFDADPQLLKDVDGLKPDPQKHEFILNYELISGSPISVLNRIQFNFQVEPIEEFDLMANMKPVLIPMFWIEESLNLDKKYTNLMKYGLYWSQTIISVIKYGGMILGVLGIVLAGYKMLSGESDTNVAPPPLQTIRPNTLQNSLDRKY